MERDFLLDPDAEIISQLGFGPEVVKALANDPEYRRRVVIEIQATLKKLEHAFEGKYHIYTSNLDFDAIQQQLLSGVPNLKTRILLSNPFVIWAVELKFQLPSSGDFNILMENWNRLWYTPQGCALYKSAEVCLKRAIKYNDFETVKRLYVEGDKDGIISDNTYLSINMAAANGRTEILRYIMELNNNNLNLLDYSHLNHSVMSQHDNSEMIRYLWTYPRIRDVAGRAAAQNLYHIINKTDVNPANINALLSLMDLTPDIITYILPALNMNGQTSAIEIIRERYPEYFN